MPESAGSSSRDLSL